MDHLSFCSAAKRPVDIIFLDFAKAFDTVPHRRLLAKLEAHGICGNTLRWIDSFLSNRSQRVVLGPHSSVPVTVTSGVPQGSVLGPILFIIFINDLLLSLGNSGKAYADDIKLIAEVLEHFERVLMQANIDKVVDWTHTWLVHLNVLKCKVLHVGKTNPMHSYVIRGKAGTSEGEHRLERTTCERDLGVIISNNTKWTTHCSNVSNKANFVTSTLKRAFATRNVEVWKRLYTTYIRPHVDYAAAVWSPHAKKDIATIERVQRRATKIPTQLRNLTYEQRLSALGLTTLETRRTRGDLITRFRIDKGLDIVNWHRQPPSSNFAGRTHFRRELVRSNSLRYNFLTNRTANAWNKLHPIASEIQSTNEFKAFLDSSQSNMTRPTRCSTSRAPHFGLTTVAIAAH